MTVALYSFWMTLIVTFKFSVQVRKAPRCALQSSGKQCVCRRALKQTPEWTCKLAVSVESFPENIKQQINDRASDRKVNYSKWNTFSAESGFLARLPVSGSSCVSQLTVTRIPCTVAHSLRAYSGAEFLSSRRTHGHLRSLFIGLLGAARDSEYFTLIMFPRTRPEPANIL